MERWKWCAGFIALVPQLAAVSVVEISVDVEGRRVPFTWKPGSENVMLKAEKFQQVHAKSLEPWSHLKILNDIKVQRALLVGNRSGERPLPVADWPLRRGEVVKEVAKEEQTILALHMAHDSSIAITRNGRVQCILELERLFGKRYFAPPLKDKKQFNSNWLSALRTAQRRCGCEDGWTPHHFTDAVLVNPGALEFQLLLMWLTEKVFSIGRWHLCDHHHAHALAAFHSSPFRSALVVSYDAAGNDGTFNIYMGSFDRLTRIGQLDYSMGGFYEQLAQMVPEVTGWPVEHFFDCGHFNHTESISELKGQLLSAKRPYFDGRYNALSWSGKLMGYSATAEPVEDLRPSARFFMEVSGSQTTKSNYPAELLYTSCQSLEGQRAVAATVQSEFENFLEEKMKSLLEHVGHQQVDGIALTGGCALNVLANQRIYDWATNISGPAVDVYVPPAPNDSGLTLGATWSIAPPKVRQQLQYLGFRLWDEQLLPRYARNRGARRLSSLGGIEYLADLLAGGDPWLRQRNSSAEKPIIAVVRGRQEFGPRALGHRSLLAVPDSQKMRQRMNRLKARQWYRPVAPMIAEEALTEVFGRHVPSPFMTMAPKVLPEMQRRFPALSHLDGTARHQSVGHGDEPWIHALLMAVGKRTGLAALINTSFNTKGKPIVNKIDECLRMLDDLPDLDFVVIEDWIFRKRGMRWARPW